MRGHALAPSEIALLRRGAGTMTVDEIAAALGRNALTIRHAADRLGIRLKACDRGRRQATPEHWDFAPIRAWERGLRGRVQ